MKYNEFYSVKLRKKISIPSNMIKRVIKKGKTFLVGTYKVDGKNYEAYKITGGK